MLRTKEQLKAALDYARNGISTNSVVLVRKRTILLSTFYNHIDFLVALNSTLQNCNVVNGQDQLQELDKLFGNILKIFAAEAARMYREVCHK
jgi:hypothetical protein